MSFKKKVIFLSITATILTLSIWFFPHHCDSLHCISRNSEIKTVYIKNIPVSVTLARTELERNLGLSIKSSLNENEGMLFVFDKEGKYGFWMKDMKFPIDIVWLNKNKIIFIEKNVSPETYPTAFYPKDVSDLVLELPAGFCDTHGLSEGDFLSGDE